MVPHPKKYTPLPLMVTKSCKEEVEKLEKKTAESLCFKVCVTEERLAENRQEHTSLNFRTSNSFEKITCESMYKVQFDKNAHDKNVARRKEHPSLATQVCVLRNVSFLYEVS